MAHTATLGGKWPFSVEAAEQVAARETAADILL
jgi:hypothetical protein